jgi:hypothetical protein
MERTPFFALVVALCPGCHTGSAPPAVLSSPSLMEPLEITASAPTDESSVTFEVASWKDGSATRLTLSPKDLMLILRTGKHGEITGLELGLGNEDVSATAVPPDGLKLRDLSLGLDSMVELTTEYASDDFLELHAAAPLRLTWAMQLSDGTDYPLGPAVTAPLAFDLEVEKSGDQATVRLYARCDGVCWSMDDLARISDGQVHLVAPATLKNLD